MQIREIMTTKVITIGPDETVKKAASIICLKKISGIPVVDTNNILMGIVSEKDILRAIYPTYQEFFDNPQDFKVFADLSRRYKDMANLKITEILSGRLITVSQDTALLEVLSLMISKRIRRIPITDNNGILVGIVSQGDIHQALFEEFFVNNDS